MSTKTFIDYCKKNKLQVTNPRKIAYKIFSRQKRQISAYELLKKMGVYLNNPKPPTVYRALEFLVKNGFVHRVESLNAYILCRTGLKHSSVNFLVCDKCGSVEELAPAKPNGRMLEDVQDKGFEFERSSLEIHGICAKCAEKAHNKQ